MADLSSYLERVPGFEQLPQASQVAILGYFIHAWLRQDRFAVGNLRDLYAEAKCAAPRNISDVIARLRSAKRVLQDKRGYYLSASTEREIVSGRPGIAPARQSTIRASKDLRALVARVNSPQGADYLAEAIACFEAQCLRAAIVMGWAVCYDQVLEYVLAKRLIDFNQELAKRNQKVKHVTQREDFAELKESLVLEVCRAAAVVSKATWKTLDRSLNTRNDYAHPSGRTIVAATAEAFIEDIVNNAIVKLQ